MTTMTTMPLQRPGARALLVFTLLAPAVAAVRALPAQEGQQGRGGDQEIRTVADLIARLEPKEREVKSLEMKMRTRSVFPGGMSVETRGTVRVLEGTHFHVSMTAEFGEGMRSETETVKTPQGVWMRERDPAQGEVFTYMDQALMRQVEAAAAVVGQDGEVPGMLANEPNALRGAAMLKSLGERYDLVLERRVIGGEAFWVVKGELKQGAAPAAAEGAPDDLPVPDHVEVLVRARDLTITRMDQLHDGKPLSTVEIDELKVGVPLQPEDFRIELPPNERFVPVLEYPPAAEQIKRLLSDAEDAGQQGAGRKQDGSGADAAAGARSGGNGQRADPPGSGK